MSKLRNRSELLNNMLLFVPAMLWGSSLVSRKLATAYMTPLFFNSMRLYAGFLFVLGVQIFMYVWDRKKNSYKEITHPEISGKTASKKPLSYQIAGSAACGIAFGIASIFQQIGLTLTTASKTGFITTFYTILIPLISWLFLKKSIKKRVWIGAVIAIMGLFFISTDGQFRLSVGDVVVFIGAIFFALQILLISHLVQHTSVLFLNMIQLVMAATISLVFSLLFEQKNELNSVFDSAGLILYVGVVCIGIAYVLQSIAMKKATPSVAGIIISFEAVFGVIFSVLFLNEIMNGYQLLGSTLILIAIIFTQYENQKNENQKGFEEGA